MKLLDDVTDMDGLISAHLFVSMYVLQQRVPLFDLYTGNAGKNPSCRACVLLLYSIRRGDQSALIYNHFRYRGGI